MSIPELKAGTPLDGLYSEFYEGAGCMILRGVYDAATMDRYNAWCEKHLPDVLGTHANTRHPKQFTKRIINDVAERMSLDDPDLLVTLLGNPVLNEALDRLLGFARWGAVTTHWLEPGGERQTAHVDYPAHVRSGKFWENDPDKLRRMFTSHQLNQVLPHFSVQTLIASDAMGPWNGATEVSPGSQLVPDVDIRVHDPDWVQTLSFATAELNQGDVLLFNRRLVHRAGCNKSLSRRNSLIVQHVMLFGIGQHAFDVEAIRRNLGDRLDDTLSLRLVAPYPRNTRDAN